MMCDAHIITYKPQMRGWVYIIIQKNIPCACFIYKYMMIAYNYVLF